MFDHPALSQQIITYIGNKRRLLPFIWEEVEGILETEGWRGRLRPAAAAVSARRREPARRSEQRPLRFLDAFAGSGVVSRMARLAGFEVWANDLEAYCKPLLRPFLELEPPGAQELFAPVARELGLPGNDPYAETLTYLNALTTPRDLGAQHFSRHYAPRSTERPDLEGERLFYTRENALRIDAVLEALEAQPFGEPLVRQTVLASLLYEMSVHINTSGVMKGFHRGWGGRRGDALGRILAPIELYPLPLISGPRGRVTTLPAEELFEAAAVPESEIIYADPPYTIHQYGANYHLLTTAALADRYDPGPVGPGSRAGIRVDHNRSEFCRARATAGVRACEAAFERFVSGVRGRYLLVSYNTDGLIEPERMVSILRRGGRNRVDARMRSHVKFRGGKNTQSERKTREILFRVELDRPTIVADLGGLAAQLSRSDRLARLLDSFIDPEKLPWSVTQGERGEMLYRGGEGEPMCRVARDFRLLEVYPAGERHIEKIEAARAEKREIMERYIDRRMVREALELLPSFKIRKDRELFSAFAQRIERIATPEERSRLTELASSYGLEIARARRS